jgi:ribonuclease HII
MKNATAFAVASSTSKDIGLDSRDILAEAVAPAQHLIIVFAERCEARALLVATGEALQDAVDGLQHAAEDQALVDHYGQDEIQAIMANAFSGVR